MNIYPLPAERFHELPIPLDPASSLVIVAEDPSTQEIKGYWAAQNVVHIEPIWFAPEIQSSLIGIKMYAGLLAALSVHGVKTFYAFSDNPTTADYAERLGLELMPYITFKGSVPTIPEEVKECLQQSLVG